MMRGARRLPLISQRVNAERLVVLGWPRAILLQFAHPLVAAGVADHSSFRRGRFAAVMRLHYTLRAMRALAFGSDAERRAALDGILAIHRRVHGALRETTGIFPAGTRYTAEDPALVLWVHATLLETMPLVYELLVGPMTGSERDAYCAETASVAVDLGARHEDVPITWTALRTYMDRMYASDAMSVGTDARALAARVLSPLGAIAAPYDWFNRLLTVGLLPRSIRSAYGYTWSERDARSLRRVGVVVRGARRLTPATLAFWPEARRV
jgi:uncharacterized protein (DUF2236 family)